MKTAKVIPLISLFFVSGLLSAMIFHSDYENPDKRGMNGLYAGGLFTVAAIVAIAVLR